MSEDEFNSATETMTTSEQGVAPLHNAALLVNASGAGWAPPSTTAWQNEATLRDLLVEYPSLLPGVMEAAVAATKEFPVPGVGRVDVVAVESSGTITVCEAKLSTNAEMRRTIIGQVVAYVAGLSGTSVDDFEELWERSAGASLVEQVLGDDATEAEERSFRDALGESLSAGRFRIMLAVDVLSEELQSIITYLSTHMDVDVVALELAYARTDAVEILVPRSFGTELSSRSRKRTQGGRSPGYRRRIDEVRDDIIASAEDGAPGFGAVVASFLDSVAGDTNYLYSGDSAMLDPVIVAKSSPPRQPAKIITSQKTRGIRVCFGWCRSLDRSRLDEALRILESNPLTADAVSDVRINDFKKRPILRYEGVLDQPGAVEILIAAVRVLAA